MDNATNITKEIAEARYALYKANYKLPADQNEKSAANSSRFQKPLRSIGIRGSDLVNDNYWEQLDLFSDPMLREKQKKMDAAVDGLGFTASRED